MRVRRVTCIVRGVNYAFTGMWHGSLQRIPIIGSCLVGIRGLHLAGGRPRASWLRHVESYLKDTCMAALASAWAMTRRRPQEYRRKVDAATRCSGVCPHT